MPRQPKTVVRKAVKVIALAAGLSLVYDPVGGDFGFVVFVGSIVVLLACLLLWLLFFGQDETSGYWPDNSKL